MKWIILIIALASTEVKADSEIMKEFNELNKKKAEKITEEILKAKGIKAKKSNGINREIDIKKPLKECIKPNNVIDNEVKKCMEGE